VRSGKAAITVCVILFIGIASSSAQNPQSVAEISTLASSLSNHSVSPEKALDPEVTGARRMSELKLLGDASYRLTITPTGAPEWSEGTRVSVPAKVQFNDETTELEVSTHVQFVERNGVWYFANYDFLQVPWYFWLILIPLFGYAIVSAVVVIMLRRRLVRSGQLHGANYIKIFVPFCWPSLFRLTSSSK